MLSTSATVLSAAGEQVPYSAALLIEGRFPVEITDQEEFREGCYNGYNAAWVPAMNYCRRLQEGAGEEQEVLAGMLKGWGLRLADLERASFLGQVAYSAGFELGFLSALLVFGVVGENYVWVAIARLRALVNDRLSMLI